MFDVMGGEGIFGFPTRARFVHELDQLMLLTVSDCKPNVSAANTFLLHEENIIRKPCKAWCLPSRFVNPSRVYRV